MKTQRKNVTIAGVMIAGVMTGVAAMLLALTCGAQVVASHAPSMAAPPAPASAPAASGAAASTHAVPANLAVLAPARPVVRVNGAVLTDRDLAREIQMIFPYQKTHDGIPKGMEPEMRKGAMQMMVFEELVYQEARRRKLTISPERMKQAEAQFRGQFSNDEEFQKVMEIEVHGSRPLMREKIRRSLLIDQLLKSDVANRAAVSEVEARAYYSRNPKKFQHGELFNLQTISIIPPENSSAEVQKEASKRAQDAWKQAKATKSYKEFGLLAEKFSDDDWHVNMGDRKVVEGEKLPPPVVQAARALKPGQVSELIQLGTAYTMFRLNAHTAAGTRPFAEVKGQLMKDLQKENTERLRADLNRRLRRTAKIEEL